MTGHNVPDSSAYGVDGTVGKGNLKYYSILYELYSPIYKHGYIARFKLIGLYGEIKTERNSKLFAEQFRKNRKEITNMTVNWGK